MRTIIVFIFSLMAFAVAAQPNTEIYTYDLSLSDSGYVIQNPVNITYQNPGYDNQPHFKPDGTLYYVTTIDGQTEVAQAELNEYSWTQLTYTPDSEYSPTPMLGRDGFSAIKLETDGTQLLWQFLDSGESSVLIDSLKIGYHCWYNEDVVVAFVLGEPSTLQVCHLKTGENIIHQKNIGRSLDKMPNKPLISYVSKENEDWEIKSLHPITGATAVVAKTLPGSEDLAWSSNGSVFMGKGSVLYSFTPEKDSDWKKVHFKDNSFSKSQSKILNGITRLAINPQGNKIAIVVNQAP
ncbi:hypothetical protein E1176_12605 [Fulvivirga sp. RKSG066]|uniref:TolB family protein n=1 Tax=Fulvivirga aurantia TaxID=2529383 RepID=UPI0012BD1F8B|nr:hypothetical protein [Fulvivirga aurantia]MTI21865.1 hypothetical protein [Fulvivirga aurantia]